MPPTLRAWKKPAAPRKPAAPKKVAAAKKPGAAKKVAAATKATKSKQDVEPVEEPEAEEEGEAKKLPVKKFPSRKVAVPKQKKAGAPQDGPPVAYTQRAVNWGYGDVPPQTQKDALLPYLAMGIFPVFTRAGDKNLCGYYSLLKSLETVRDVMKHDLIPDNLNLKYLRDLLESQAYKDKAEERIELLRSQFGEGDFVEEAEVQYSKKTMLDGEQIWCLLDACNDEWGTQFSLGIIREGYHVRWNMQENHWEYNREHPHSTYMFPSETELRDRPVIWIWSDNQESKFDSWGQGKNLASTGHWEGFGRLTPEVFAKEQFRQTRAQNWNLGDELQDDVEKGVWYADRDISEDEGDNFLTVSQCAFLRQYELIPEGVEVLVGHLYVHTCNVAEGGERTHGIVPREALTKVELHEQAPGPMTAQLTVWMDAPDEEQAKTAQTAIQPVQTISSALPQTSFKIFRMIEASNKVGGKFKAGDAQEDDFNSDTNNCDNGDFFLDNAHRTGNLAHVTDISGLAGQINRRRLQAIETPWGFQNLEAWHDFLDEEDFSHAELGKILIDCGQKPLATKKNRIGQLKEQIKQLPLYRVTKGYSPKSAESQTPFYRDEIVRLMESYNADKEKMDPSIPYHVQDYEGRLSTIAWEDLEPINHPFGFNLDGSKLPSDFFGSATPVQAPPVSKLKAKYKRPADEEDELALEEAEKPKKKKQKK